MKPLNTAEINYRIADKPVALLGSYVNRITKTEWQCKICSHTWKSTFSCIQGSRRGCPRCAGRCQSVQTMIDLAKAKGFAFLSNNYHGMNFKYEWKCRDGHLWMASAHHIKSGTGCPYCNSYITEEACRFIFQELTGQSFRKNRSTLGKRLELDGYCDELKIAFEYQGKQHYSFIKYLHKQPETHKAQKRRDDQKRSLCKERKIDLLEIPYHVNDLEPFIRGQLESVGVECSETIDWEKFKGRISMLEELKIAADKLDIESLSDVYINARSKINFRCNKCGREWESTSNDIKNGYGCLKCSGKMKLTIDEVRTRGQTVGIKLLSKEYVNARTKLRWECDKCNHVFMKTPPSIQQSKGCPACGRQNAWKARRERICCES